MTTATKPRYHHVDGLRGLAIATIIAAHFVIPRLVLTPLQETGLGPLALFIRTVTGSGVEIFCMISGLVLLGPFINSDRPFTVSRFYQRRVQRLWPPYAAALLLTGGEIWLFTAHPNWLSKSLTVLPAFHWSDWLAQIFILNLGNPIYNGAWWFLSVEIVFYLTIPLLVLLFRRLAVGPKSFLVLLGCAWLVAEAAFWVSSRELVSSHVGKLLLLFASYALCYMLGALITKVTLPSYTGYLFLTVSGAWLAAYAVYPLFNYHNPNALMAAGLLLLSSRLGTPVRRVLTHYLMVWIGERSYSLFLIHLTTLTFGAYLAAQVFPADSVTYYPASRSLAVLLTFLVALPLFNWLERPFARGLLTAGDFWPHWRRSWPPAEKEGIIGVMAGHHEARDSLIISN